MDMWFKATKRRRTKFEPRVRVWKLKEEKTCEECRCMVEDKVEEAKKKGLGVNDHWQQMKGIMMETAQDMCGMTKGPRRHKETWWWNEEVAEAVRDKKLKYGKWKKENTEEARMEYKKNRQNAKRVLSLNHAVCRWWIGCRPQFVYLHPFHQLGKEFTLKFRPSFCQ